MCCLGTFHWAEPGKICVCTLLHDGVLHTWGTVISRMLYPVFSTAQNCFKTISEQFKTGEDLAAISADKTSRCQLITESAVLAPVISTAASSSTAVSPEDNQV